MSRKTVTSPKATLDILGIAEHISHDSESVADRFLVAVDETVNSIAEFPHIGAAWQPKKSKYKGMRCLSVKYFEDYLIFYRPAKDFVEVIRVIHGARDLNSQFE